MSTIEPPMRLPGKVTLCQVTTEPPTTLPGGRSVTVVDNSDDVREFLATRRARITPQQVGLPIHDSTRRVPGLRREEVAVLAGVSIDYYTRLERGNLTGVSDSVLEAVARALLLDEAERSHLFDLARQPTTPPAPASADRHHRIRPGAQRLLDAMHDAPALVRNARLDVVAANPLGRALFSPAFADATTPTNLARFTFLDEQATEFFLDWDDVANATVALLRVEAGRNPGDHNLSDLVGELATRSDEFRSGGPATTSASMITATNASITPSSATSPCRSKNSPSPPTRPHHHRLHRRAGNSVTRRARPPRQLDRHNQPDTQSGTDHRAL